MSEISRQSSWPRCASKEGGGGTKYVPYLYIALRFDLSGRELGKGGGASGYLRP